jgi:hypothetical protein
VSAIEGVEFADDDTVPGEDEQDEASEKGSDVESDDSDMSNDNDDDGKGDETDGDEIAGVSNEDGVDTGNVTERSRRAEIRARPGHGYALDALALGSDGGDGDDISAGIDVDVAEEAELEGSTVAAVQKA